MGPDESDEQRLSLIVHCGDSPILVATNIKDDPIVFQNARLPKLGLNVLWDAPLRFSGFRIPGFQRPFGISILGHRFSKPP
jgi:hypothetical protein